MNTDTDGGDRFCQRCLHRGPHCTCSTGPGLSTSAIPAHDRTHRRPARPPLETT